ncbi:hypothetical protein DVH24_024103 [Malus domestica]|uniref:Uncharacterized protein n=1 Tax=Malus domestica TaxID=3750 RepID=A0A498JEZ5_MALDO|nr:hypothetical protein DVH24_024103 [Malus domestica]
MTPELDYPRKFDRIRADRDTHILLLRRRDKQNPPKPKQYIALNTNILHSIKDKPFLLCPKLL